MGSGPLGLGVLPNLRKKKPDHRATFNASNYGAIGRFIRSLPKGSAFVVQEKGSKTRIAVWNDPADVPRNIPRQP